LLLERGDYEIGSLQELIAIKAKQMMNRIRRMEVQTVVNAVLTVANATINPNDIRFDTVNDSMSKYAELLFPELKEDREDAVQKAMRVIKENDKMLKIRPIAEPSMARGKLSKKRI